MSNNKQVEKLRAKLYRELPKAHPLKEHLIDDKEEYVKNLYIDMLCVIAQYDNEDSQFALNFIRRIMAGAEMNEPVTDHVKNAMEITEERFDEFLRQCKEQKLENIFVVDALIISCANGKPNKKQVEFISEISEALKMKKKTVEILGRLAVAILEQNSDKYHEVYDTIPKNNIYKLVMAIACYLKEFAQGILADCDDLYWVYYPQKTEYTFPERQSEWKCENRKTVIFENLVISGESIFVYCADTVTLTNCELAYARIINVREFNINNCEFDGLDSRYKFYIVSDGTIVNINNSIFKNYTFEIINDDYGSGALGSARKARKKAEADFGNYKLIGDIIHGYYSSIKVNVSFCKFINIHSSWKGDYLFSRGSNTSVENSEFINCDELPLFDSNCKLANNTYTSCSEVIG